MESYSKSHFHYEFAKSFHWHYFVYKISIASVFFIVCIFLYSIDKGLGGLVLLTLFFCAFLTLFFMSCVYLFCFLFLRRFFFLFIWCSWYRSDLISYLEYCKEVLSDKDSLGMNKIRKKIPFVTLRDENIQDAEWFILCFCKTRLFLVSNSTKLVKKMENHLEDECE